MRANRASLNEFGFDTISEVIRRAKTLIISGILLLVVLSVFAVWLLRPVPRKESLFRLVPRAAIGFVEIDDIPNLFEKLTHTKAWTALAPALGLPDQLKLIGAAGSLLSATGLGPREAVILSSSQLAVILTAVEAEGDVVHPKFVLTLETHADSQSVERVRTRWIPLLAERIFGSKTSETVREHSAVQVTEHQSSKAGQRIFSTSIDGILYVSNDWDAVKLCLDTRLGRAESMAREASLDAARETLGPEPPVFAFVSGEGLARLTKLSAYLFGGSLTRVAGRMGDFEETLQDVVSGIFDAFAYSMDFENGLVNGRKLLLLRPAVISRLKDAVRPAQGPSRLAGWIPADAQDVTLIRIAEPGQAIDDLLALVSSRSSVVTSAALRQVVVSLRNNYALRPNDELSKALGDEASWFRLSGNADSLLSVSIRDDHGLEPLVQRFVRFRHFTAQPGLDRDVKLFASDNPHAGGLLLQAGVASIGPLEELRKLSGSQSRGLAQARGFADASLALTWTDEREEAALAMITVSRAFRTTDGSISHLHDQSVQDGIQRLTLTIGTMRLSDAGIELKSSSPLGWLPQLLELLTAD